MAEFREQTRYQIDVQNPTKGGYDMVDGTCASENVKTATTTGIRIVKTSVGPVLNTIPNIAACPQNGGTFLYWLIDGHVFSTDMYFSNADEHIINDYGDHHITAVFDDHDNGYSVTVRADNPNNGSVSIATGQDYSSYGSGDSVTIQPYANAPLTTGILTVTPASGFVFDYFSSEANNTTWTKVGENQYILSLTDQDVVTAHFRSSEIQVRYVIGPNDDTFGGINTTQDTCGEETSRIDIITTLDSNGAIDVPANNIIACPNTNYEFVRWELDGQTISNSATLSKSAQQWPDTGTHELRAIFVLSGSGQYTLPFTGSGTIWLILGGGIGLVAIPSVILIINERKEQKKGGKK
jgi:hypothetical protein